TRCVEVLQSPRHVVFGGRQHAFNEQFFLGGEVTVDGGLGTAHLGGNFRNRGLIEPPHPEQPEGGVQDSLPLVVAFLHVRVASISCSEPPIMYRIVQFRQGRASSQVAKELYGTVPVVVDMRSNRI